MDIVHKAYIGSDETAFSKVITKDSETSSTLSWSGAKSKQELDSKADTSTVNALQTRYQTVVNNTPAKANQSVLGNQFTLFLTNVSGSTGDLYITTL